MKASVRQSSEYTKQKYDLLSIRLRDKMEVVPSSPDSALRVLQYFTQRSNAVDKERACYYVGSAYRDLKDYPQAVNYFLKATDAARQGKDADTLLWQNALSQLSHLYILLLNYEEELNVAMQSVELAKASQRNLAFYLADVATAYQNLNDTLLCLQYLDEAHRAIRQESEVPILVLTSSDDEFDEVMSMRLGADDYVAKPYRPAVLLAHVARLVERAGQGSSPTIEYAGISLDAGRSTASFGERTVELTRNETCILAELVRARGKIVSRQDLMVALWQTDEFLDDNTLTVNVNRLRRTLESLGAPKGALKTHRGQGYSL